MSVPPDQPPVYTDPATGRRYSLDPATGQSRWLDTPGPQPGPFPTQQQAPWQQPAPRKSHTGRNIVLALLGVFVLLIIIGAVGSALSGNKGTTSSGSSSSPAAPATTAAAAPSKPAASTPAKAPAQGAMTDQGWTLVDVGTIADDGVGQFGANHVRIRNDNTDAKTATFTITLTKSGQVVGTLSGAANQVAPGKTVTVMMVSTDKFAKGPYQVEFQVNASF